MWNLLKTILILCLIYWVYSKIHDRYINGEKSPFWKNTEQIQVCKIPYYSSSECYRLDVTLVDKKTTKINFNNGGYIYTDDLTCYFAAQIKDEPRYTFCRSWDNDGNQWDYMPTWVNY